MAVTVEPCFVQEGGGQHAHLAQAQDRNSLE